MFFCCTHQRLDKSIMSENANVEELGIPHGLQKEIALLDHALSTDKDLKGKIVDLLEAYL